MRVSESIKIRPGAGAARSRLSRGERAFYEPVIQRILADRQGHKTWGELEGLERRAKSEPAARAALSRLEALHVTSEFLSSGPGSKQRPDAGALIGAIDEADVETQQQIWKRLLAPCRRKQSRALLGRSRHTTGWRVLGLPPCVGGQVGPLSGVSLQQPDQYKQLLTEAFTRRIGGASEDSRAREYRQLYRAYKRLQSGQFRGRVSGCALYLDLKELEQSLIPENLTKAREGVRGQLLGGCGPLLGAPKGRAQRFLKSLTASSGVGHERLLFDELSALALSRPRELAFYANLLSSEIRRCPHSLAKELLPKLRRALGRVSRTHALAWDRSPLRSETAQARACLQDDLFDQGVSEAESSDLEHYRSGLTFNGFTRDYTSL